MSKQDIRTNDTILLVSEEGIAETKDEPWIRKATKSEFKEWRDFLEKPWRSAVSGEMGGGRTDIDDLHTDNQGKKYILCVVTRKAPPEIWCLASGHLRMLRVTELTKE